MRICPQNFKRFVKFKQPNLKQIFLISGSLFIWILLTMYININYFSPSPCEIKDLLILDEMGSRDAKLLLASPLKVHLQPESKKQVQFSESESKDFKMLMIVMSTSDGNSREMRDAIRNTWGNPIALREHSSRVVFFIGISESQKNFREKLNNLEEENARFGDLIVIDFQESYYRLPVKVLRMLEWFTGIYVDGDVINVKNSFTPTFLMKIDEDVLLNLPKLFGQLYSEESLFQLKSQGFLVAGKHNVNVTIVPDPQSKFYISKDFWLGERSTYPNYLNGPCYLMSGNLAERVYKTALETPMFPFEDIYLTGFVMGEKLKLLENVQMMTWYNSLVAEKHNVRRNVVRKMRNVTYTHGVKSGEIMQLLYEKLQLKVSLN